MREDFRFTTPEEMRALERAARRARAEAIAGLLAAAGGQLKELIVRGATVLASKVRPTDAAPRYGAWRDFQPGERP